MDQEEKIGLMKQLRAEVSRAASWIYFLDYHNYKEVYQKLSPPNVRDGLDYLEKNFLIRRERGKVKRDYSPKEDFIRNFQNNLVKAGFLESENRRVNRLGRYRISLDLLFFYLENLAREKGLRTSLTKGEKNCIKGFFDIRGFRKTLYDLYIVEYLDKFNPTIEYFDPKPISVVTGMLYGVIIFLDESIENPEIVLLRKKDRQLYNEWFGNVQPKIIEMKKEKFCIYNQAVFKISDISGLCHKTFS